MLKGKVVIAISRFIKEHINNEYKSLENVYVVPEVLTKIFSLLARLLLQGLFRRKSYKLRIKKTILMPAD